MEDTSHDILIKKVAAALRDYEVAHPENDVTIDLVVHPPAVDGISCLSAIKLMSASYAMRDIRKLIEDSNRPVEPANELDLHLMGLKNSGHKEVALELAREIVKAYPSNPNAYMWLAEAFWGMGMHSDRDETIQKALSLAHSEEWLDGHDYSASFSIRNMIEGFEYCDGFVDGS